MEEVEPPTTAKIVMYSTCGPLEIELWGMECPRSVRAFLQLCLEGYYEETPFHRCIPGYLVQGGDPTGTGEGGEAPGGPLPLESHPRLHWTRRGLVGLAPAEGTGLAGSQFFITLAPTPELDRKATLIGRLVGQTIYNLVRMGEAPRVPGSESLAEPRPRITSVSVVDNPWHDIVPRELPEVQERRRTVLNAKKAKPPPPSRAQGRRPPPLTKASRLTLSFAGGDEAQNLDVGAAADATINMNREETTGDGINAPIIGGGEGTGGGPMMRIRSSHEVLHNDPTLSRDSVTTMLRANGRDNNGPGNVNDGKTGGGGGGGDGDGDGDERTDATSTSLTLEQLQRERRARIDQTASKIAQVQEELRAMRTTTRMEGGTDFLRSDAPSGHDHGQDSLSKFLGIRRKTLPTPAPESSSKLPKSEESCSSPSPAAGPPSKMYKERKRLIMGQQRRTTMDEMDTLLALNAFRDKLKRVEDPLQPGARKWREGAGHSELATQLDICKLHGLVNCQSCRDTFGQGEMAGPEAEEGWLMHRLVFDREAGYRELRSDLDQLQVIDPRTRMGGGGTGEAPKKD